MPWVSLKKMIVANNPSNKLAKLHGKTKSEICCRDPMRPRACWLISPSKQTTVTAKRVFKEKRECKCTGFNAKTLLLASIHHVDPTTLEILFSIDIV